MRRQGAKGEEIIEALITNSATFEEKTLFSQEKYRLKKQKKYAPRVLLRRPFTQSKCETYSKKYPAKIGIARAPLNVLSLAQNQIPRHTGADEDGPDVESNGSTSSISMEEVPQSSEHEIANLDHTASVSPSSKMGKALKAGERAPQEALKSWKEHGFSSPIIAAPYLDAWSLVKYLLPLLSYSAPFAMYLQYLKPLKTCMHNLQIEKMATGLQISEPWLREYQVLPSRTHPRMQMSAFGGFILSGTRICSS